MQSPQKRCEQRVSFGLQPTTCVWQILQTNSETTSPPSAEASVTSCSAKTLTSSAADSSAAAGGAASASASCAAAIAAVAGGAPSSEEEEPLRFVAPGRASGVACSLFSSSFAFLAPSSIFALAAARRLCAPLSRPLAELRCLIETRCCWRRARTACTSGQRAASPFARSWRRVSSRRSDSTFAKKSLTSCCTSQALGAMAAKRCTVCFARMNGPSPSKGC
mmetsp:Transcript_7370/g.18503  ORF Transcript_7370/g.18503 Transcript_7370/m.18503 type:complete len:221 (-) Transcript_7370:44-706(-)